MLKDRGTSNHGLFVRYFSDIYLPGPRKRQETLEYPRFEPGISRKRMRTINHHTGRAGDLFSFVCRVCCVRKLVSWVSHYISISTSSSTTCIYALLLPPQQTFIFCTKFQYAELKARRQIQEADFSAPPPSETLYLTVTKLAKYEM